MKGKITRRGIIKRVAYVAPIILAVPVDLSFAKNGSVKENCNNGLGNGVDCQPPGDPKPNDISGIPGRPHQ